MNRDQAVSFGDPMPMRLGKALTKEELEKRAAEKVAEDHGRQVRVLSAHAAAYGTGVLAGGGPLHESTSALRWATEFSGLFSVSLSNGLPAGDDTQGLMLGWFANAIEAGRTAGLRGEARRRVALPRACCPGGLARVRANPYTAST